MLKQKPYFFILTINEKKNSSPKYVVANGKIITIDNSESSAYSDSY